MTEISAGPAFAWADLPRQAMEYWVDAAERTILFWDAMRERGNIYVEHALQGKPALLQFEHQLVIDGRTLARPCNYSLLHVLPGKGTPMDPAKRPFVIVDPRAGHGPGIGGFKPDSQVGMALRAGHPVYFVTFSPEPVDGQTLGDIADAEAHFIEEVSRRHPEANHKPVVIANCQAGWAVAALAAVRPEIMGVIALNGAPLSYWAGSAKQNPMRYSGGVLGGSWLASFVSDLAADRFDGANLVANFENLNPANTYWTKYYQLYSKIDTEAPRFLEFERWWGGFFRMTGQEIEGIVENLFVGNRLARGEVAKGDVMVDLRNITVPVVVFASWGDNITPPQQALNWIIDVWGDEKAIVAAGRTIVYMLHETIGHLGIFVGSGVARKEHDQLVNTMDVIERLPPGLYEMVVEQTERGTRYADLEHGKYSVRFEPRRIDDIRALEPEGRGDEQVFDTIAQVSEINARNYREVVRPLVRAMSNRAVADAMVPFESARLQRLAASDVNPAMRWVAQAAERVRATRHPVAKDNAFLAAEKRLSERVEQRLDAYRDMRDAATAEWVEALYGPLGLGMFFPPRESAEVTAKARAEETITSARAEIEPLIRTGGFAEAVARMLLAVAKATGSLERRSYRLAPRVVEALRQRGHPAAEVDWPPLMRQQARIMALASDAAINALPELIPGKAERELAVAVVAAVMMLEPTLAEPDSPIARRVHTLLGVEPARALDHIDRARSARKGARS